MHDPKNILVALDFAAAAEALALVDQLDPGKCRLKVGKELFTAEGPALLRQLHQRGFEVFLDLKFHDIPNTVAKAVTAAAELGVWMVNVHAQGGSRMMQAARDALLPYGNQRPLLIAVTVLTSMSVEDLAELGLPAPAQLVPKLAQLARDCGLDGVVSSAQEAAMIKQLCGTGFVTVTPGIRPAGADQGDQRRILTPEQAVAQGADYLVIGRPITRHETPLAELNRIVESLQAANRL
ncbi:MAG TPA: orotidine-5'-phosphate decarboxylase [Pseudomonadales bacterium]